MDTSRRASVSDLDLNLEEILLAMADTDRANAIANGEEPFNVSQKSRPLPTPQVRPRRHTEAIKPQFSNPHPQPYLPQQVIPQQPIYSQYPVEQGYDGYGNQYVNPGYNEDMYVDNNYDGYGGYNNNEMYYEYSHSTPELPTYPNNYYDPNLPDAYGYPQQGQIYVDEYGEYYQQVDEYYDPYSQQNPHFPQQTYDDNQFAYPAHFSTQSNYSDMGSGEVGYAGESVGENRCSTPRRPLPRLPPKKAKEADLKFSTPPINNSIHLGLKSQNQLEGEIRNEHPIRVEPPQHPEPQQQQDLRTEVSEGKAPPLPPSNGLEDTPENLAALMADITLQVTTESHVNVQPKLQKNLSHRHSTPIPNSSTPSSVGSTTPASIPKPPPRLSKEVATQRLSASIQRIPTHINNKLEKSKVGSKNFLPTTSSPLTPNRSKLLTKERNEKLMKRGLTRLSAKPLNPIQILQKSKPITEPDVDGFDFDESDFDLVDKSALEVVKRLKEEETTRNVDTRGSDDEEEEVGIKDEEDEKMSLETVAKRLSFGLKLDWQIYRAIFIYIVNAIAYDFNELKMMLPFAPSPNMEVHSDDEDDEDTDTLNGNGKSNDFGDVYLETAKAVFTRKRARKIGFANLFKAMTSCLGLECEVVEGYLKDPANATDLETKLPQVNHAWIAVKIQGYYRFLDPGLATLSHPYNLSNKPDLFYFLVNPSKLIFTHFPTNKSFQYLQPSISFHTFVLLPYATSYFFDYGVKLLDLPSTGPMTVNDDATGELNLQVPEDMLVTAELELFEVPNKPIKRFQPLVQLRTKDNVSLCKVCLRVKGKAPYGLLKVRLGYLEPSSVGGDPTNNGYNLPFNFSLRVLHNGTKPPEDFVKLLSLNLPLFIVEPINFDLLYNITYRFHVLPKKPEGKVFKLALRSPTMKPHKFVYYPTDQGYVVNVTLRERGQWAVGYLDLEKKKEKGGPAGSAGGDLGNKRDREGWVNLAVYRCI